MFKWDLVLKIQYNICKIAHTYTVVATNFKQDVYWDKSHGINWVSLD